MSTSFLEPSSLFTFLSLLAKSQQTSDADFVLLSLTNKNSFWITDRKTSFYYWVNWDCSDFLAYFILPPFLPFFSFLHTKPTYQLGSHTSLKPLRIQWDRNPFLGSDNSTHYSTKLQNSFLRRLPSTFLLSKLIYFSQTRGEETFIPIPQILIPISYLKFSTKMMDQSVPRRTLM